MGAVLAPAAQERPASCSCRSTRTPMERLVTMHYVDLLTQSYARKPGAQPLPVAQPSFDRFGRRIDYLRISLTDRCNLRCVYCMPATGMHFAPRDELLTDAELLRVIRLTTEIGFRKVRLTGGQAPARQNLPELVCGIDALPR